MNAFTVLMTCGKRKAEHLDDGGVIGVCYEAKLCGEGVDVDDPLYGICYYGIAVRHGFASPEALQAKRQRQHERHAVSDPKELGIRAIIARYGTRALVWSMVQSKIGDSKSNTQEWANKWEKQVIAEAGGMLRDMDPVRPIPQTLNLTKGGQGDAGAVWAAVEARSAARWKKFQCRIEAYIDEHKTARVPNSYVCADGYRLGAAVADVRQGNMIKVHADKDARCVYLDALPGWTWNCSDASWEKFKASMLKYVHKHQTSRVPQDFKDDDFYPLGKNLNHVRNGIYLKAKPDEADRRLWLESLPEWTWNNNDYQWETFRHSLLNYVRQTGSAYVSKSYVNEHGYPLGMTIYSVRKGQMVTNHRDAATRRTWLENLPGWKWKSGVAEGKAHETSELILLRATTHPEAKRKDVAELRNAHAVICAHEIMRDRAVASVIDDVLDAVMARTS